MRVVVCVMEAFGWIVFGRVPFINLMYGYA